MVLGNVNKKNPLRFSINLENNIYLIRLLKEIKPIKVVGVPFLIYIHPRFKANP